MRLWKIGLIILFFTIIFFCLMLFFIAFYFKIKSRFWFSQPVFHIYDISYYFFNKGIINKLLPNKNLNFIDFKNVSVNVIDWNEYNKNDEKNYTETINDFVSLIQEHYFINKENKNNKFYPKHRHIIPYMSGHNAKCFLTYYKSEPHLNNKFIGVMTSRPIHIYILSLKTKKILQNFDAYYIDFLCVKKNYRKMGIAEKIIQTHEYFQRHNNKQISVSIFKREEEITGIVPICIYKTYGFNMKPWKITSKLENKIILNNKVYECILVNKENIHFLYSFLKEQETNFLEECHFEVFIITSFSNLSALINTKNIYVYYILENDYRQQKKISCVFFFRNTRTFINKDDGEKFISLFASIKRKKTSDDVFIKTFKYCLYSVIVLQKTNLTQSQTQTIIYENDNFTHLLIEDISDNGIILKNIRKKTQPILVSPTAFFFYNFAWNTFSSSSVFVLY